MFSCITYSISCIHSLTCLFSGVSDRGFLFCEEEGKREHETTYTFRLRFAFAASLHNFLKCRGSTGWVQNSGRVEKSSVENSVLWTCFPKWISPMSLEGWGVPWHLRKHTGGEGALLPPPCFFFFFLRLMLSWTTWLRREILRTGPIRIWMQVKPTFQHVHPAATCWIVVENPHCPFKGTVMLLWHFFVVAYSQMSSH